MRSKFLCWHPSLMALIWNQNNRKSDFFFPALGLVRTHGSIGTGKWRLSFEIIFYYILRWIGSVTICGLSKRSSRTWRRLRNNFFSLPIDFFFSSFNLQIASSSWIAGITGQTGETWNTNHISIEASLLAQIPVQRKNPVNCEVPDQNLHYNNDFRWQFTWKAY